MNKSPEVTETKTITYLAQKYTAPVWVKFVAADSNGKVFGYEFEPAHHYFAATGNKMYMATKGQSIDLGVLNSCPVVGV